MKLRDKLRTAKFYISFNFVYYAENMFPLFFAILNDYHGYYFCTSVIFFFSPADVNVVKRVFKNLRDRFMKMRRK